MSELRRPVVVQHCFGKLGLGGPMSGLHRLLQSPLRDRYRLVPCFQDRPARGINVRLLLDMARQIRAARPALMHVRGLQNEGFHGLVAGRLAGCKRVLVSVHGTVRDIVHGAGRWRRRVVGGVLEPYTLRQADAVFCVCDYAANRPEIRRSVRRLLATIHNGVPLPPLSSAPGWVREHWGIGANEVVITCVSRMTREKGVDVLCHAAELLQRTGRQNVRIVLVGDGPDMALVRRLAERSGAGRA